MTRVLAFGLFVFFCGAGFGIAAAAEPCVSVHVHPKDTLRIDVPAGMRPTRSIAGFLVDVDSTGIVTKTAVLQSSGDIVLDIFSRDGIEKTTFVPESRNCVAIGTQAKFGIGLANVPTVPAGEPTPVPEILDCTSAVDSAIVDPAAPGDPRRGSASGRAIAQVSIDEHGAVTAAAITRSANDPLLDAETLRVARASTYTIRTAPTCPAGARTASIDLNFLAP